MFYISDSGLSLSIWNRQLIVQIFAHHHLDFVPISFRSCTKKKKKKTRNEEEGRNYGKS